MGDWNVCGRTDRALVNEKNVKQWSKNEQHNIYRTTRGWELREWRLMMLDGKLILTALFDG